MEPLQKQVITLSQKVDALYQVIEQLTDRVSDVLAECRLAPIPPKEGVEDGYAYNRTQSYSSLKPVMEHKDILIDGSLEHRQSGEKQLTPEIQIQRLTAQLTAAYNRIAALEEQLFSRRIH